MPTETKEIYRVVNTESGLPFEPEYEKRESALYFKGRIYQTYSKELRIQKWRVTYELIDGDVK